MVHGCKLSQMFEHPSFGFFLGFFIPAVYMGVVDVCVETVTHPNVHFTSGVHELYFLFVHVYL